MKNLCFVLLALLFVSSTVFAADFVPTNKLDIDVPDFVQYNFDGSPIDIPVEIMGTAGRSYLIIETTGLAGVLPRVTNGRIGWHTVNGIDTTVYCSAGDDLEKGQKYITWSGKNNDGNNVAEGEYTFYVWAFDHVNTFQPAMPMSNHDRIAAEARLQVITEDESGTPMAQPWLQTVSQGSVLLNNPDVDNAVLDRVWGKWTLGNDPYNIELIESCLIPEGEGWTGPGRGSGRCPFVPGDYSHFFRFCTNVEQAQQAMRKFKLNPNDTAEEITDWGEDLRWSYEVGDQESGCDVVDDTYIVTSIYLYSKSSCNSYLLISSVDGDKVDDVYQVDWDKAAYVQEHGEVLQAGGPLSAQEYFNGRVSMGTIWCMNMASDPVRYLESGEYEDFVIAINEEGDGYNDKGWSADNPFPDFCYAEDPPWNYSLYGEKYGIAICATQRGGPISWSLLCPDFTAVTYCSVAGETDTGQSQAVPINVDGAYDGMYLRPNYWKAGNTDDERGTGFGGLSMAYLGFDSDMGTISKEGGTSVAAATPAAFAVAQSSPNPANPTTTISFSIPEAGNVSVDIFNVAGQKVDTLVNNFMDAGSHSVVWDGSSLASGVYFYTVTSGEFSKTMKMTLLK